MKPRLIIEQKLTAFTNQYSVFETNEAGEKGTLIAFAQQKKLAFKEKVEFFTAADKKTLAFTLQAEKAMDIHGKFFVLDPKGKQIGQFRKEFKQSLVSSTWSILDAKDKPILQVTESNTYLAVARRTLGFIPFVGEFIDLFMSFIRFHFKFIDPKSGEEIGFYRKTTRFYDRYMLSMDDKTWKEHKPEAFAAIAVALDALQSR